MKIALWTIGKSHEAYVQEGIGMFTKRLSKYFAVEWQIIPVPKNAALLPEAEMKQKEGESILALLKEDDYLVALDERGKMLTSEGLSNLLAQRADSGTKRLIFLIGGAYGLDIAVLAKAKFQWSLSSLTFPHQLVRLILAEQLYRACTILRNEKYHHR
jgi:23S rRNA (pseudouridine1915-N3)-methyltransferase